MIDDLAIPAPASRIERQAELEIPTLARKLSIAYSEMVEFIQTHKQVSLDEAYADAQRLAREDPVVDRDEMLQSPPDQVSWHRLQALSAKDAELGIQVWQHLKRRALDELESGHRAAQPLEWQGDPWDRARFLALIQAFTAEWQPRGGIEATLIDMLAQQYTAYLYWLGKLHISSQMEAMREDPVLKRQGYFQPLRLDASQSIEYAAGMVDRFNRLFLRTLRALREHRKYAGPPVVVQNAGQVNVAQQQVNVAATDRAETP
jgi:hypothetical protein